MLKVENFSIPTFCPVLYRYSKDKENTMFKETNEKKKDKKAKQKLDRIGVSMFAQARRNGLPLPYLYKLLQMNIHINLYGHYGDAK